MHVYIKITQKEFQYSDSIFVEKLYDYVSVMVCVAVKGKPFIGVIHKPFMKSTSWAWINKTKSKDLEGQVTYFFYYIHTNTGLLINRAFPFRGW